mmetsp:Transcript_14061/g.23317  ORF Transcript_14061/g.23317 Transcript_14061/m.23317 type:complete len:110 (+) Transcript_14061:66-395(+)
MMALVFLIAEASALQPGPLLIHRLQHLPARTQPAEMLALPSSDIGIPIASAEQTTFLSGNEIELPPILLADVIDAIAGFADSPLILLLPIGAGTLVACVIIFILVKSAG